MRELFVEGEKRIEVDLLRCTRSDSTYSSCTICQEICPASAIRYRRNEVIVESSCTECSLCAGSCPSEAISFDGFDTKAFVSSFDTNSPSEIFCTSTLPCLGVFSDIHMLALLIKSNKNELTFNIYKCGECEFNDKNSVFENCIKKANEANRLAKELGIKSKLTISTEKPNEKRALFDRGLSFIRKSAASEVYNSKEYLSRLELLQDSLKDIEIDESRYIKVGFSADIDVDSSCTFCQECSKFCPTQAIKNVEHEGERVLEFYQGQCIACDVCSTICKESSITLKDSINAKSFINNSVKVLAKASIKTCKECKCGFYSNEQQTVCNLCIERLEFEKVMGFSD